MDKARPVVLEGINKGLETLINPLVSILSLSVSLGIVGCGQFELCA